jgi:hypothetical protein
MSKTSHNQKFETLMQWLCGLGKMKKVGNQYESTKPKKLKLDLES